MITISEQLRKYLITISILSIAFITITSNLSINYFFSDYIRDSRSRDDLKVVQYVEQVTKTKWCITLKWFFMN